MKVFRDSTRTKLHYDEYQRWLAAQNSASVFSKQEERRCRIYAEIAKNKWLQCKKDDIEIWAERKTKDEVGNVLIF